MIEHVTEQEERLYYDGANYAADAVVINGDKILLIRRSDTGEWALPGGFRDKDESALTAAKREVCEETRFVLVEQGYSVYKGRVDDPRNSERRWIETEAFLFFVDSKASVEARDDADDVEWFECHKLPDLYGSHGEIVRRALLRHDLENGIPEPTKGGHMSYEYQLLHTDRSGPVFVKRHVPERHQTARREASSRAYLVKETAAFNHLRDHEYRFIPKHTTLFDDSMLAMEGLPASRQWHWRAPSNAHFTRYVDDCLEALSALRFVQPLPETGVTPSIISFAEEGWETMNDDTVAAVERRFVELQPKLKASTARSAESLISRINELRLMNQQHDLTPNTGLSHHDARQANIAWHPEHGARLVDWSWAGPGNALSDVTTLLIDLKKSGHDVSPWTKNYFSREHALLMIGFWLAHSTWPTRTSDDNVRLHQLASAATAYELLF